MSTEVSVSDEAAIKSAIADVKNNASDTGFLICGHVDGNPNMIELRSTGSDTTQIESEMLEEEVLYCLARYTPTFEMSTVTKFVFIHWIGEKVPFVKRGRFGIVLGSVEALLNNGSHLFLETSSGDDLDQDKIIRSLNDSMGTTNKVLENAEASTRQMRGFTQTQLPQKSSKPQFSVSSVSSKGHNIEVLSEVKEALARVQSDTEPEMWVVAGYRDNSPKGPLEVVSTGTGDLSELKDCLVEDAALYSLLKVPFTNADDIPVVKFVYIIWVGPKVKPMAKAKTSTHKGLMEDIFSPSHHTVFATEPSEISATEIMSKLKNLTS